MWEQTKVVEKATRELVFVVTVRVKAAGAEEVAGLQAGFPTRLPGSQTH